jgi:RHS repeat-associated protein
VYAVKSVGSARAGGCAGSNYPFLTSKERDIEIGLDYFLARYYSSNQGRFTSPDEFSGGPDELYDFAEDASDNPTFYGDLSEPQSLNKYQYCYNNPLAYVDPDGHAPKDKPSFSHGDQEAEKLLREWQQRREDEHSFRAFGKFQKRPRSTSGAPRTQRWVVQTDSSGRRRWRYFPGGATWRDLTGPSPRPALWQPRPVNGSRVYQRNSNIDPNRTDASGRTNRQRMRAGLAPIGSDGKEMVLHHALQTASGPLIELTATQHREYSRILHINPNTIPSGINRRTFDTWRANYWRARVNDFE